jgi:hypothetical protein
VAVAPTPLRFWILKPHQLIKQFAQITKGKKTLLGLPGAQISTLSPQIPHGPHLHIGMRAFLQCAFFLPALVIGTCTTEVGIDYPGHDLKPLTPRHVPAYSDCCAACLNVTECSHWTFQANPGSPTICWLKDAGAGKSRKPTKNHVSGWAGTGPAPSPAPSTPVAPCSTDLSCQLNGICTAGKCVCDPAWKGDACEQLSLVPAKSLDPAYPPAAWKLNTTSWGGSVVKAEDGKYHMFAAEMLNSCGMSTWTTNSAIRHAVASAPEGEVASTITWPRDSKRNSF